jgi:hypothetical protein
VQLYDPFFLNSDLLLPFSGTDFNNFDLLYNQNPPPVQHQQILGNESLDSTRTTPARIEHSNEAPPWLCNLSPALQPHDPEIVSYFVNKFMSNVAHILPTYHDIKSTPKGFPDLVLAMAAVGGLFSPIAGSFRMSLSLHTDARRLALGRVSIL